MVYTNGELLIESVNAYPDLMAAIWLYSVSIDGDEEQHSRVRPGTSVEKITRNLQRFRISTGIRSCSGPRCAKSNRFGTALKNS